MAIKIVRKSAQPVAVGMGLVALDLVFGANEAVPARSYAGGTCGNVLTILSYLGWQSFPISRLHNDRASKRLVQDLRHWKVSTKFVTQTADGSTPIIVQRIRRASGGAPRHSFSWRCPSCGAYLPGYKPVLATEVANVALGVPHSAVFFFDRVSRATLLMASIARRRGAVVFFEPASVGDPGLFKEAWALSHVVKYSHERLREMAEIGVGNTKDDSVLLEIETIGAEGLRYRSRLPLAANKAWVSIEPFPAPGAKDTSGAGDWFTAGFLNTVARKGAAGLQKVTKPQLQAALQYGQALAAWNCGFEGARRGMYESTRPELDAAVKRIVSGSDAAALQPSSGSAKEHDSVADLCLSCIEHSSIGSKTKRKHR